MCLPVVEQQRCCGGGGGGWGGGLRCDAAGEGDEEDGSLRRGEEDQVMSGYAERMAVGVRVEHCFWSCPADIWRVGEWLGVRMDLRTCLLGEEEEEEEDVS